MERAEGGERERSCSLKGNQLIFHFNFKVPHISFGKASEVGVCTQSNWSLLEVIDMRFVQVHNPSFFLCSLDNTNALKKNATKNATNFKFGFRHK